MPKTTKTRINTSKTKSRTASINKQGFKFRWWMAVLLIVVVGGVGLVVLRFSRAGGLTANGVVQSNYYGVLVVRSSTLGSITLYPIGGGLYSTQPASFGSCARVYPASAKGAYDKPGSAVTLGFNNCG